MSVLLSLAAIAVAVGPANYDCTLQPPRVLEGEVGQERSTAVELPEAANWRFQVAVTEQRDGTTQAEVRWQANPIQIAGRFPALPTAPGALAFAAFSGGPCLFTESACMTLVHLVDESPQQARVVLTPSALVAIEGRARRPFTVLLSGTCTRSEANR